MPVTRSAKCITAVTNATGPLQQARSSRPSRPPRKPSTTPSPPESSIASPPTPVTAPVAAVVSRKRGREEEEDRAAPLAAAEPAGRVTRAMKRQKTLEEDDEERPAEAMPSPSRSLSTGRRLQKTATCPTPSAPFAFVSTSRTLSSPSLSTPPATRPSLKRNRSATESSSTPSLPKKVKKLVKKPLPVRTSTAVQPHRASTSSSPKGKIVRAPKAGSTVEEDQVIASPSHKENPHRRLSASSASSSAVAQRKKMPLAAPKGSSASLPDLTSDDYDSSSDSELEDDQSRLIIGNRVLKINGSREEDFFAASEMFMSAMMGRTDSLEQIYGKMGSVKNGGTVERSHFTISRGRRRSSDRFSEVSDE
ncbi:hypothetical protein JCM10213_005961 [Rhodosporidiobolus nylandii]